MTSLPSWLIKKVPKSQNIKEIRGILGKDSIHTVCESAMCPNIGECYSQKTVTFMILGNVCTRTCKFCAVEKHISTSPLTLHPLPIDPNEPKNVAEAAKKLGLKYVVITSVTRDDLPDNGADQFAKTIKAVKTKIPDVKVEVLIPDLQGKPGLIKVIAEAKPNIINHNLETVPRIYTYIRPQADYKRSLFVLKTAKSADVPLYTKSGIMVGLGEIKEEVVRLMEDLRRIDCDILTIGQYLRPSKEQVEVSEYIHPDIFEEYSEIGQKLGFKKVFSGPFVRSSYKASEINV